MDLTPALTLLKQLTLALSEEVDRARGERQLLRTLDAPALLERAARRQHFNTTSASLERQLSVEIARAAATSGMKGEATASSLARLAGLEGTELIRSLAEVRALATALVELDLLNHHLAERTLRVVRGYTTALAPRPAAYNRLGRTLASTGT